jgi:hypothetical protein
MAARVSDINWWLTPYNVGYISGFFSGSRVNPLIYTWAELTYLLSGMNHELVTRVIGVTVVKKVCKPIVI